VSADEKHRPAGKNAKGHAGILRLRRMMRTRSPPPSGGLFRYFFSS
jgi:hypothetical protein